VARAIDGAAPKSPAKLLGLKIVPRIEKADTKRPPTKRRIKIIFNTNEFSLEIPSGCNEYTVTKQLQYGYSDFERFFRCSTDEIRGVPKASYLAENYTEKADTKLDIRQATASYETWLRGCTTVIDSALRSKHEQMRADSFLFFRGTYYRWTQVFPEACRELAHAPRLLCSGDLHVGSFGTWRDREGRLCWGVDDFDDAYPLAYTNDLVRLVASLKMVIDAESLTIKYREGCDAILEGYEKSLKDGGCPFVLAEHDKNLEKLGFEMMKPPLDFWQKLKDAPPVQAVDVPADARAALTSALPPKIHYKISRRQAGLGSLGQPRFVALGEYAGGCIAREVKATVPSACVWRDGKSGRGERYYARLIASAVRSHDPYQRVVKHWVVRRLSPDSNPIEVEDLPKERDEYTLLHAMGKEVANVHLGSSGCVKSVLKDLSGRDKKWLRRAGKQMARVMVKEWKAYAE
jgi:hypothetical protein